MKKKLLVVLLMICLVFGLVACKGPDTGAFNYFEEVYDSLKNENDIRLETIVYDELWEMFENPNRGQYLIFFGGSWDSSSQALIKTVNQKAVDFSVSVIYHFDPNLDGNWSKNYNTGMVTGSGTEEQNIKMTADLSSSAIAEVSSNMNAARTNLKNRFANVKDTAGNIAGEIPVGQLLFVKDSKVSQGTLSLKLTETNLTDVQNSIEAVILKSCVDDVNKAETKGKISTVTPFYYFSNKDLGFTEAVSDESDYLTADGSHFKTVTYHELMVMLKQIDGKRSYTTDFLVLIGNIKDESFQVVAKSVAEAAKKWSISTIYVFNPVLAPGVNITANQPEVPTASNFQYTVLYADLLTALGGKYTSAVDTAASVTLQKGDKYNYTYEGKVVSTAATTISLPKMSGATLLLVNNSPAKNSEKGKVLNWAESNYTKQMITDDVSGKIEARISEIYGGVVSSHKDAVEVVASSSGGDTSGGGTTTTDPNAC